MTTPTTLLTEPDTPPGPVLDPVDPMPDTDRTVHIALACQLLTRARQTGRADLDPPGFLPDVAATLLAEHGPLPAVPTAARAHHHLAAALAATQAVCVAARQQADRDEQRLADFHTDVRRRAAEAYNAKEICLEGTNDALQRLGIAPLQLQYTVDLLVPVTVQVNADDADDACRRAEQQLREELAVGCCPPVDPGGIRCETARAEDEYIDPDDID